MRREFADIFQRRLPGAAAAVEINHDLDIRPDARAAQHGGGRLTQAGARRAHMGIRMNTT